VRDFWVLTLLYAFMFVGINGLMVHLIPLLEDVNYSSAQAASILGLMFLLSGVGRIGTGVLADMIDFRIVMVGLISCQIAGLLILSIVGPADIWLIGLFTLLFGIGFGGMIPLGPFLIMQLFGARAFGALQGLVQCGAAVAGVVGPVFFGWVFDTTASYDLAIYATLATIMAAIPFIYLLRKPQTDRVLRGRPQPRPVLERRRGA
jgi:MFS family permease